MVFLKHSWIHLLEFVGIQSGIAVVEVYDDSVPSSKVVWLPGDWYVPEGTFVNDKWNDGWIDSRNNEFIYVIIRAEGADNTVKGIVRVQIQATMAVGICETAIVRIAVRIDGTNRVISTTLLDTQMYTYLRVGKIVNETSGNVLVQVEIWSPVQPYKPED